ncbi:MAG: hypothetical protein ACI39U_04400 [Candidatus Cryptobacteroides sp.]
MRQIIRLLVSATVWAALCLSSGAQNPTTTYPYLYDHFIEGTVVMKGGARELRQMNIHLRRDALHYIDNGIIREAFLTDVAIVEIGSDFFIPVGTSMMKLREKNDTGCVVEAISGDFETARESTGAYGISSTTSATMKLTSIQTDAQINQNYMNILNERDQGMSLPVESKLWLVWAGRSVEASRKAIGDMIPQERQAEWKSFQKSHKIKWKEPASLLQVIDFISSL